MDKSAQSTVDGAKRSDSEMLSSKAKKVQTNLNKNKMSIESPQIDLKNPLAKR